MIVVTGGSGFIGSNLARALVGAGHEVVVVDDVDPSGNLRGVALADHLGQEAFRQRLLGGPGALAGVDAVVHQGACSSTTETDEDFLRRNNLEYSVTVLEACQVDRVPLIYASSAAVYGDAPADGGLPHGDLRPLNGYARSKAAFDRHVVALDGQLTSQVVGLRYFNVFGPGEEQKGPMASMVLQAARQLETTGTARIFGAGGGAAAGRQRRDFVAVDDVVAVVRWFLAHPDRSGIFDCGTGTSRTFQELAEAVVAERGAGDVVHIPFPSSLEGRYQADTQADLSRLRAVGCDHRFLSLEEGVHRYLTHERGPWRSSP